MYICIISRMKNQDGHSGCTDVVGYAKTTRTCPSDESTSMAITPYTHPYE